MSPDLLSFLALLAAALLRWHAVFFLVPAVARARFVHEVSALRDDLHDAVITGAIEDSPAARSHLQKYELYVRDVRRLNFFNLYALHAAFEAQGVDSKVFALPKYQGVSAGDQAVLDRIDHAVVRHLANLIVLGSSMWLPLVTIQGIYRLARLVRAQEVSPRLSPTKLADEFSDATDSRQLQLVA